MKVTITIDCDNAAFDNDPAFALGVILHRLSVTVDEDGIQTQSIRDLNGNTVGKMEVSE